MPVNEGKLETRVMVLPSTGLEGDQANIRTIKLRHPKTDSAATFLHNSVSGKFYEILAFNEEHRAWFIGEKLISDGRLFLATPINPIFLVLPYLIKAERLVPLDQMLEDENFPFADQLLNHVKGLEKVAESKGDADLNVWKYNRDLTLNWLVERVDRVSKILEKQKIDLTQGASSYNYRYAGGVPKKDDYRIYAYGIVSEYISASIAKDLEEKLGIEEKPVPLGQKRQSLGGHEDTVKAKKLKTEGPLEDYSNKKVKAAPKEEKTAKEKALAIGAKGTKSISCFFKKA